MGLLPSISQKKISGRKNPQASYTKTSNPGDIANENALVNFSSRNFKAITNNSSNFTKVKFETINGSREKDWLLAEKKYEILETNNSFNRFDSKENGKIVLILIFFVLLIEN